MLMRGNLSRTRASCSSVFCFVASACTCWQLAFGAPSAGATHSAVYPPSSSSSCSLSLILVFFCFSLSPGGMLRFTLALLKVLAKGPTERCPSLTFQIRRHRQRSRALAGPPVRRSAHLAGKSRLGLSLGKRRPDRR